MKEYDRFEKRCRQQQYVYIYFEKQMEESNAHIIITTIQKLAKFYQENTKGMRYLQNILLLF